MIYIIGEYQLNKMFYLCVDENGYLFWVSENGISEAEPLSFFTVYKPNNFKFFKEPCFIDDPNNVLKMVHSGGILYL